MRIRFAWGVAVVAALARCGGAGGPSLSALRSGLKLLTDAGHTRTPDRTLTAKLGLRQS